MALHGRRRSPGVAPSGGPDGARDRQRRSRSTCSRPASHDVVGLVAAGLLALVAHAALRSRCGRLARLAGAAPAAAGWLWPRVDPAREAPGVAIGRRVLARRRRRCWRCSRGPRGGAGLPRRRVTRSARCSRSPSVHASTAIALRWRDPGRYRRGRSRSAEPRGSTAGGFRVVAILGAAVRRLGRGWPSWCSRAARAYLGRGVADLPAWHGVRRLPRAAQGLSLGERALAASVAARTGPALEVEFQTMLIPGLERPRFGHRRPTCVEVAAQLAAERRASLVLLAFTEIPLGEEMDLEIDGLEEAVERPRRGRPRRSASATASASSRRTFATARSRPSRSSPRRTRRDSQLILLLCRRAPARGCCGRVAYDHAVRRDRGRGPPARDDRPARAGRPS